MSKSTLRVATVIRGELLRDLVAQGRIVTANSPTLFSGEQGFVILNVKPGDEVIKGQILAEIISPELNEALEQQSSLLNRMKIEYERQKIQSKRRIIELIQLEELANVELKAKDRENRRSLSAYQVNLISEFDFEQAKDNLERASLGYKQAKQNNTLENETLAFDLETLALQVQGQQLLIDGLQRRIQQLTIRSPVEGMVGNVQVTPRQAVSVNQALITVVDLTAFEIEASVAEGYADELVINMAAEIRLDGEYYHGELMAISPEVLSGQVVVRLRFTEGTPENLRQNQRLTAKIILERKEDILLVERGALLDNFDGYVYKLNEDKALKTKVNIGSRSLRQVEILEGLNKGDTVIISPLDVATSVQEILVTD